MLISLHRCTGWSAPLLFANPQRQVFLHQGPIVQVHSNVTQIKNRGFFPFSKQSKNLSLTRQILKDGLAEENDPLDTEEKLLIFTFYTTYIIQV